jgi:DNA-binding response OmpR family regulator
MKKILVIDDEEWLREMIQLALRQRGYDVTEASSGSEGIEKARKEFPDLILCDVNMGKVDGYLTLSSLRNEAPTAAIPFILMTGLADNAGMRHGMELGADDYLPKPFTTDQLYAAVEARLKKSQTVRDEAERKLAHLRDNISLVLPHEMRTPLNGIITNAELLATSAASLQPEEIAEMGQEIYKSSLRLERVIENSLIYAQLELLAADPQSVNALRVGRCLQASAVVQRLAAEQGELAGRSNDLFLETSDFAVPMSEEYFKRVINEIVSVTDSGRGFSNDQVMRIGAYVQFERKIQDEQGLGLGLTIAKRLIDLHGGTLQVESEKGTGSTVTVKLPKIKAA